jgi:hypothetical protein
MSINFGQADYYSPQIEIVGKEVPLAAMEKTGNVLQDRFDKSYENETKTEALMKKAIMDADEIDRPMAQKAYETYQQRLKDRASKGDYHNMRWETIRDAQDFANIYTGLSEKAKKMQQYRDAITTYKGIADPGRKQFELKRWAEAQNAINFDPENRQLTGLGVNAPQLVDDVDVVKFYDTYGKGFEEDIVGRLGETTKKYEAGEKMSNGQLAPVTGFYDSKTGRKVSEVKSKDIEDVLNKYISADPSAQAYFKSLGEYYQSLGLTPEEASSKVKKDLVDNMINAAGTKYGFKRREDIDSDTINASATANLGMGPAQTEGELYTPASLNVGALNTKEELDNDFRTAFAGNSDKFNEILGKTEALMYVNRNNPDALHNLKNLNIVTKQLQELSTLSPEIMKSIASSTSGQFFNPISGDMSLLASTAERKMRDLEKSNQYTPAQKKQLTQKLHVIKSLAGSVISNPFTKTFSEQEYADFERISNKNVPMASYDLNSAVQRGAKNSLGTDLNINDFTIVGNPGFELGKDINVKIQKFSTESLGSGRGVVFQAVVKDKDGNEREVNIAPKNRQQGRTLIKEFSRHVYAPLAFNDLVTNGTSFYEDGESKKIGSILKANDNPELNNLIDPKKYKDVNLTMKDGAYFIDGVVNDNRQPVPFKSPNQALYFLVDKNKYNQYIHN